MKTCPNCGRQFETGYLNCCSRACDSAWSLKIANTVANVAQAKELAKQTKILEDQQRKIEAQEEEARRAEIARIRQVQSDRDELARKYGFSNEKAVLDYLSTSPRRNSEIFNSKPYETQLQELQKERDENIESNRKFHEKLEKEEKEKTAKRLEGLDDNDKQVQLNIQKIIASIPVKLSNWLFILPIATEILFIILISNFQKGFTENFGIFSMINLSLGIFAIIFNAINMFIFMNKFNKIVEEKAKSSNPQIKIGDKDKTLSGSISAYIFSGRIIKASIWLICSVLLFKAFNFCYFIPKGWRIFVKIIWIIVWPIIGFKKWIKADRVENSEFAKHTDRLGKFVDGEMLPLQKFSTLHIRENIIEIEKEDAAHEKDCNLTENYASSNYYVTNKGAYFKNPIFSYEVAKIAIKNAFGDETTHGSIYTLFETRLMENYDIVDEDWKKDATALELEYRKKAENRIQKQLKKLRKSGIRDMSYYQKLKENYDKKIQAINTKYFGSFNLNV